MPWRERAQAASFRGLPFYIDDADGTFGRRGTDFEFPDRDTPYASDTGRKARVFTLTGKLVGENHDLQARDLIAAMEQHGPGRFVHPWLGEMQGTCRSGRVRQSIQEGGVTRLEFTFTESGEAEFPAAEVLTLEAIDVSAATADDDSATALESAWAAAGTASFVLSRAERSIAFLGPKIEAALDNPISKGAENIADIVALTTRLVTDAPDLARGPVDDIIDSVHEIIASIESLETLKSLYGDSPTPTPESALSSDEQQARDNDEELNRFLQRAALSQACRTAADTEFAVFDEAERVRDNLGDRLAAEAEGDPAVFDAFTDLRGRLVADIDDRSTDLARLRVENVEVVTSAIELAHRLYDDPTRAFEIIDRNQIPNGGFVSGAVNVLTE
jgi:prophage DNA circulation protein